MTQQHPIAPPPELVRHWSRFQGDTDPEALWFRIANEAAQWGADQELEACCEWLMLNGYGTAISRLRAARRPKPPSLKEQALDDLRIAFDRGCLSGIQADTIRRALEQLPDHE
jgi:DNA-directed RNA polymerase specialized sigma24 family protein